jgi:uncharacterized membrane protein
MNFGVFIPIVAIIASACVVIALLHFAQEKRALEKGSTGDRELERENEMLRETVARLEERMAVLERIATDPAERTAREIEQLR